MSKPNASTRRTRKKLLDACLQLAEHQDIATITVRQITDLADLNRTTFYLHFPDVPALLQAVTDDLLEQLGEGGRTLLDLNADPSLDWQETYFSTLALHSRLFLQLLKGPGGDALTQRLLDSNGAWIAERWRARGFMQDSDPHYRAMQVRFAAAGAHGLTVAWLEAGMPVPPREICVWNHDYVMAVGAATSTLGGSQATAILPESPVR
ncbi:MAG: TetR/AcrR family transcriptional regulator [Thermomicrobiales bacterium]